MPCNRRLLLFWIAGSASLLSSLPAATAEPAPHPDSRSFQPGDLLWTRNRDAYVPFNSVGAASYESEKLQWEADRDRYLQERHKYLEDVPAQFLVDLRMMSFDQFRLIYIDGLIPNQPTPYYAGRLATGHVAILGRAQDGVPFVIEAVPSPVWKVRRLPYPAWVAERQDQLIWHGRLRNFDRTQRAAIVSQALTYLDRPYSIFTFSLLSEDRFYCSKLVWLSIMKSLKVAVDGQQQPYGWLSPKTVLYAPPIARLHEPRNY